MMQSLSIICDVTRINIIKLFSQQEVINETALQVSRTERNDQIPSNTTCEQGLLSKCCTESPKLKIRNAVGKDFI